MTLPDKISIASLIEYGANACSAVSDSAKLDAQLLLCEAIGKERTYLLTWPDKELSVAEVALYESLINRRIQGEPVAYILGMREFWSLPLEVNPSTLIPRPDTEVLVETVLNRFVQLSGSCLDLGTGTGAIALAIASEKTGWQVEAVDFNKDAVALARRNAARLNIKNCQVYRSDWFNNIDENKSFDVIVSNPPYIDEADPHLEQGDVRFEPKTALVASNSGLADIEHIAEQSMMYLKEGGALFVEHGFEQGKAVRDIFEYFNYSNIVTVEDYNGHPRITFGFKTMC